MGCNVIEVIPDLGDGGAETLVKDYCVLAKEYNLGSAIPVVIWGNTVSANVKQLNAKGINVIPIFRRRNFFTLCIKVFFGKLIIPLRLNSIANSYGAQAIHFHLGILKYAKPLSSINGRIKIFYTCHSVVERYFSDKRGSEYKAAEYLLKKKRLTMIALHNSMKKELDEKFGIDSTVVVFNGINFDKYANIVKRKEDIRLSLNIPEDAFVVGHVGRLLNHKNHKFIIETFRSVLEIKPNAFLLLIGDGALEEEVKNQIKEYALIDKAILLSHRTDVHELMKAMDVFFFPSLFEGLGIVLIEAQVSGVKCVVSDRVPREVSITDLVHFHSLEEPIVSWVEDLLENQTFYTKLKNYEEYDMRKVMERLFKYYGGYDSYL